MEKLSFIILNYNSSKDTIECVQSILNIDYKKKKIIIVDNNSNDNSSDKIINWCKENSYPLTIINNLEEKTDKPDNTEITLIINNRNSGYSTGNNIGIDYSLSLNIKFGAILNPDTRIINNEFENIINILKEKNEHFIISPSMFYNTDKLTLPEDETETFFISILRIFLPKLFSRKQHPIKVDKKNYYYISKPHGCCFFTKLDKFREIELFDENIFLSNEESIIRYKTRKHKLKIIFFPNQKISHLHPPNKQTMSYKYFIESRKYLYKQYYKWNKIEILIWGILIKIYYKLLKIKNR